MGTIVGGAFEDYGNTIEYTVSTISAYERISGDRVRLYVTEERGDRQVLQYTIVAPVTAFAAFGLLCLEIAGTKHVLPDWAISRKAILPAH